MPEISCTEIANNAVADAVKAAVYETPTISGEDLNAIAVKVAKAVAAGFAEVTSSEKPSDPRS